MKSCNCLAAWVALGLVGIGYAADERGAGDRLPRVFNISARDLARTRELLKEGCPTLSPALDALRKQADKALQTEPVSVMDKDLIPPSGDKHDYMSFGPYWWPDPTKEDGLPYIRRDGELNPDSRTGGDRQRFGSMASHSSTLALAYYLTGREEYAEHAARLIRVWFLDPATRMNPHLEFGQAIPGRTTGRGIGIIDTVTLMNVVDAVGLLGGSKAWTARDQEGLVAWYDAYLEWLLTSSHGQSERNTRNNHAVWYDAQVACYALFVGRDELAREILQAVPERHIDDKIEPDGSQPREISRTRSFGYSIYTLRAFFRLATLGEVAGVDLWGYESDDGRSIRKALDFLAPYADPENEWPYPDLRTVLPRHLRPFLTKALAVFGDERYRRWLDKLPDANPGDREILLSPKAQRVSGCFPGMVPFQIVDLRKSQWMNIRVG